LHGLAEAPREISGQRQPVNFCVVTDINGEFSMPEEEMNFSGGFTGTGEGTQFSSKI
jgi:hypothetical protein